MRGAAGLALLSLVALAACGLEPVYSGGSHSAAATMLSDISVAPIPDRAGFLVGQALRDRLGEPSATPHYRLEVELDDQIISFGIRGDNSSARERRTLRARYRLITIPASGSGEVVLDATAASDSGIDRVSSDYAVVAAETTALERLSTDIARQISAKLAVYAHGQQAK
jgi:LPS-assembly lipoprotein